jgi:hypothetical protein
MEVSIYTPEATARVFRFHINQITGRIHDEWSFYHDAETFNNSAHGRKLACFQIPYPYSTDIEDQINAVYDTADHILIIGSELHAKTVEFVKKFDRNKITYFICGYLHWRMLNSRVNKFLDWFTTSVHFYKHIQPTKLFELRPFDPKPKMFDALLGRKKPHRDQAFEYLQTNNMMNSGVVTYINDYRVRFNEQDTDQWRWQADGIADLGFQISDKDFTVDRVNYYGYSMSISQIVPIDIYNETAYSLVCETNFDNQFVFITEKTIKPILARRLFITLGNQYHLAALRRLGFKTFDSIIDESYDSIELPAERHAAAMDQLKWLCLQDQADILKRVQPIVDYNFNLMYTTDWYNWFRKDFGDFFFSKPNRIDD